MAKEGLIVEGLDDLLRALAGLAADHDNTLPVLEVIAERVYYPAVREQFETEGRGRWPRRSAEYERRLRRRYGQYFDLPVGQVTGGLMRSLVNKGAPSNIHVAVGHDGLMLGSRRPYVRAFNRRREIFDFPERTYERMYDVAREEFAVRAAKRGFGVRA
jgi:hypothetical protein